MTWDDIDWDAGVIWIRRALRRPGRQPDFAPTKTGNAVGAREVDRRTLALLRLQRILQAKERPKYVEWHNLVFTATDGSPIHWSNWRRRVWVPLLKAANLPYRKPYILRHTNATQLGAAGVSPNVLQQRLGHSHVSLTLSTYRHAVTTERRLAAELAGKIFLGSRKGKRPPDRARDRARPSFDSKNVTEQTQA